MGAHSSPASTPRVSVLIPTFNYGRFLGKAIESVLAQEFADYELIISDDASGDESAAIIAEYAARDHRIRAWVHRERLGMVANWNWCLRQARGRYVKYLFGDDLLVDPTALGRLTAALDAAPNAVLVASARRLINEAAEALGTCNDLRVAGQYDGLALLRRCLEEDRNLIGEPSAALFRREVGLRGFDPQFRQIVDLEFWFHLLLRGDFIYLSEPLCGFRRHGGQQTYANRGVNVGSMESLFTIGRYIDFVSNPAGGGFTPHQVRVLLYERLYYSRKNVPSSAGVLVAEAAIRSRLTFGWYVLLTVRHRLVKPFRNLARFVRRWRYGSASPAYTDFARIGVAPAKCRASMSVAPNAPNPAASGGPRSALGREIASRRELSPTAHARHIGCAPGTP